MALKNFSSYTSSYLGVLGRSSLAQAHCPGTRAQSITSKQIALGVRTWSLMQLFFDIFALVILMQGISLGWVDPCIEVVIWEHLSLHGFYSEGGVWVWCELMCILVTILTISWACCDIMAPNAIWWRHGAKLWPHDETHRKWRMWRKLDWSVMSYWSHWWQRWPRWLVETHVMVTILFNLVDRVNLTRYLCDRVIKVPQRVMR